MTSHLNSHGKTDIKPEMFSGVQTGNGTPHDKYNIHGIAHARTNRKYNLFMQRRLVQNFSYIFELDQGTCPLTKPTRRLAYSLYLFPACCLLRFAAFFRYIMDITQRIKCLFTDDKISVYSISLNIKLLLIDT